MSKRRKLGMIGGLTAAVIASTITMADPASAWVSQQGTVCRSSVTGSFATASFGWGDPVTFKYDSCIVATQPNAIGAIAKARGVNPDFPIDMCAQLINVANGSWAHDYGCWGWASGNFDTPTSWDNNVPDGTYVVRVGFWMKASCSNENAGSCWGYGYYGDAESPRITVGS